MKMNKKNCLKREKKEGQNDAIHHRRNRYSFDFFYSFHQKIFPIERENIYSNYRGRGEMIRIRNVDNR